MNKTWAQHNSEPISQPTNLFKSNVDSNWKTWAREKTVLVFFLRLPWMPFSEESFRSQPEGSKEALSSSPISAFSSSDSSSCSRYVEWEVGDRLPLTLIAGDALFSLRFVEVFSAKSSGFLYRWFNNCKGILPLFWLSIEMGWWFGQGQPGGQIAPYRSARASHWERKPNLEGGK